MIDAEDHQLHVEEVELWHDVFNLIYSFATEHNSDPVVLMLQMRDRLDYEATLEAGV